MKRIWILLLAAAVLFLVSACGNQKENSEFRIQNSELTETAEATAVPEETQAAAATEEPEAAEAAAETEKPAEGEPEATEQPFLVQVADSDPATAYVLVRMQNAAGLLPLPQEGEYTRTIRQTMADGTEAVNVLHLTTNGFWMEESNCEGHDCINEGEVTLENREERVLWNMVICLPHQLSAELITREEAIRMLR